MPQVRLTAKRLDALTTGAAARVDYFDLAANIPGFGIRVTAKKRVWFLMYRTAGQLKRLKIGTYPPMALTKARDAARRALLSVQVDDADPAAARKARRTAQTFGALALEYLDLYAKPRKRTWREDARQLRSIVLPKWKNRPAIEITKGEVSTLIDTVAATRGGTTANRLFALLSKVFRWAVSKDKLPINPMAGLQKPAADVSRDRELSDAELCAFWQTLATAEDDGRLVPGVALWLRLRLLTAQRATTVARMKWANVDLTEKVWDIPAADMKGKKPHVVPLSPSVCKLLKARRAVGDKDATFVLEGERSRRIRLGVMDVIDLPDFQLRDLRRTAATGMTKAGISRFVVARVLGHVDRTVTGIYDRYEYLNEKRIALDTWDRRLTAILEATPAPADVVPFTRSR
jgi:integrase